MPYPGVPGNLTAKMERCVTDVMATGKDKSAAVAICHSRLVKKESVNNVKFDFTPEFTLSESNGWVEIGGIALVEGVSRNNNQYTIENLKENDGKSFKWLFGHPDHPEEHVIGKGKLTFQEGKLFHTGKIKNTTRHPDVVESIKDGFLGPSIHASAKKITREGENYKVEGLSIDGIGLVAFQGVGEASIDYAIAESFDKNDVQESPIEFEADEVVNNDKEVAKMPEEPVVAAPETPVEPVAPAPVESKDTAVIEEKDSMIKSLQEENAALKESKKKELVEQIVTVNKTMDAKVLMAESDDKLKLILEYEKKLASSVVESAIVEKSEKVSAKGEETMELVENNGCVSLSEAAYKKFNDEIRNRI